jgi:hypothetical protein
MMRPAPIDLEKATSDASDSEEELLINLNIAEATGVRLCGVCVYMLCLCGWWCFLFVWMGVYTCRRTTTMTSDMDNCVCVCAGLHKTCDCYCVCTLQLNGPQLAIGGLFSPRSKTPGTQLLRTETIRNSDTPRWKTGQAQFRHRHQDDSPACLEISLMASRLLGSELLGRTHIELATLLLEAKTDRWYPIRSKNSQETGNVRVQTAGGRSGSRRSNSLSNSDAHSRQDSAPLPQPHHIDSFLYLQSNPPPGTYGGIPAPGTARGGPRPPQRPGGRGLPASPIRELPASPVREVDLPRPTKGPPAAPPDVAAAGKMFNPYGGNSKAGGEAGAQAASATFQYKCGEMVGKGAFGKVFQV